MVREYVNVDGTGEEFNAFLSEFQRETDRAAAVLAAAYLDSQLESLLSASFIGTRAEIASLVGQNGALGAFSARIRLCAAIGLISGEVGRDLDRVRDIRNKFAHRLHGLSFATQNIADKCEHFVIVRMFEESGRLPDGRLSGGRERFNLAVTLLSFHLRKQLLSPFRFRVRATLQSPLDEIHRDDLLSGRDDR